MADENRQEGVNARRRRKLTIGKEETLLILRAYEQHPSQWKAIIDDIKANMDRLPNTHQQLYITATTRQLRDRISSEFTRIIYSNIDAIEDDDIRMQALRVRGLERRLLEQPDQVERNQQQHVEPNNDRREQLLQELSYDEDQAANNQQEPPAENPPDQENPPAPENPPVPENLQNAENLPNPGNDLQAQPARAGGRQRRGRRSLPDMLRENQLLYRRFLTKKVPKLLRELGVSSDTSDDDYV